MVWIAVVLILVGCGAAEKVGDKVLIPDPKTGKSLAQDVIEQVAPLTLGEWGGVATASALVVQNLYLLARRKGKGLLKSKKRT